MTDALLPLLPGPADADRPWLVWYAPDERVELTGHVLSMWQSKTAGLLSEQAPPAPSVRVALDGGWRLVTWCAGTWLAGGEVLLGGPGEGAGGAAGGPADVSVAYEEAGLDDEAELQLLVPRASLAVRWNGELPPLVLDGLAEVMTYPDRCSPVPADDGAAALGGIRRGELVARLDGEEGAAARAAAAAGSPAVLVRGEEPREALLGVLAAWRSGLTAVLLAPGADEALVASAARQEGVRP